LLQINDRFEFRCSEADITEHRKTREGSEKLGKKPSAARAIAFLMLMVAFGPAQAAVDVEAAKELARTNDCLKCHSADKDKKGPSMQKISDKYRGKPDAQEKVIQHFTSGPTVTLPDGLEIRHRIIDTKDPKERANIADWFLSH
jgi:cytochrome c